jgi:hypothetical protein
LSAKRNSQDLVVISPAAKRVKKDPKEEIESLQRRALEQQMEVNEQFSEVYFAILFGKNYFFYLGTFFGNDLLEGKTVAQERRQSYGNRDRFSGFF